MLLKRTYIIAFAVPIVVSGCSSQSLIADSSCKSFRPISSSKKDTEQTRREVVAHNKVFDTICPREAPAKVAAR